MPNARHLINSACPAVDRRVVESGEDRDHARAVIEELVRWSPGHRMNPRARGFLTRALAGERFQVEIPSTYNFDSGNYMGDQYLRKLLRRHDIPHHKKTVAVMRGRADGPGITTVYINQPGPQGMKREQVRQDELRSLSVDLTHRLGELGEANYGPASLNPDMFDEFVAKVSSWVLSTVQSGELKQGVQQLQLMLGDESVYLQARTIDSDARFLIRSHPLGRPAYNSILGNAFPGYISRVSGTYRGPTILLGVPPQYFTTHAKWLKTDLQSAVRHELTHIFQGALHMNYPAAYKDMPSDTATQKAAMELSYLTEPGEVEAYVQSVIGELDTSKDFSTALKGSEIWAYYTRMVFPKYPKLRSKMLSKIATYWNQRVGGKTKP